MLQIFYNLTNSLSVLLFPPLLHCILFLFSFMVSDPNTMASTATATTTSISNTGNPSTSHTILSQSPLLLLSKISNLMSIKLDYSNYIPWKHQLVTILESYSLIEHIDDSVSQPCPFLLDIQGNSTTTVTPEFQTWRIRDKALLSLINSTLTP